MAYARMASSSMVAEVSVCSNMAYSFSMPSAEHVRESSSKMTLA
jgi:hypothetical protein